MSNEKHIESKITWYNNVRYMSVTDSKWKGFVDSISSKDWVYEKNLNVPDFTCNSRKIYVEMKGADYAAEEIVGNKKYHNFIKDGWNVVIIWGFTDSESINCGSYILNKNGNEKKKDICEAFDFIFPEFKAERLNEYRKGIIRYNMSNYGEKPFSNITRRDWEMISKDENSLYPFEVNKDTNLIDDNKKENPIIINKDTNEFNLDFKILPWAAWTSSKFLGIMLTIMEKVPDKERIKLEKNKSKNSKTLVKYQYARTICIPSNKKGKIYPIIFWSLSHAKKCIMNNKISPDPKMFLLENYINLFNTDEAIKSFASFLYNYGIKATNKSCTFINIQAQKFIDNFVIKINTDESKNGAKRASIYGVDYDIINETLLDPFVPIENIQNMITFAKSFEYKDCKKNFITLDQVLVSSNVANTKDVISWIANNTESETEESDKKEENSKTKQNEKNDTFTQEKEIKKLIEKTEKNTNQFTLIEFEIDIKEYTIEKKLAKALKEGEIEKEEFDRLILQLK